MPSAPAPTEPITTDATTNAVASMPPATTEPITADATTNAVESMPSAPPTTEPITADETISATGGKKRTRRFKVSKTKTRYRK
jgi:hypothetical protein